MTTRRRRPAIELLAPAGAGDVVLTARGGRVRGDVLVRNPGSSAVAVTAIALAGELPGPRGEGTQTPSPDPSAVVEVDARGERLATVRATIDRFTPPGTYEAEVVVDGTRRTVTVQVPEEVALALSAPEIVVVASPGEEQVRHVAITNLGNVPLQIARVGPAELAPDRPRPTLLQRLGVLPRDDVELVIRRERPPAGAPAEEATAATATEEGEGERAPAPTVAARLDPPVTVAPGETVASRWIVTVEGEPAPGVRYRAVAALLTADVRIVVVPAQDGPATEAPSTTRARATRGGREAAARGGRRSPSQERRTR